MKSYQVSLQAQWNETVNLKDPQIRENWHTLKQPVDEGKKSQGTLKNILGKNENTTYQNLGM